MSCVLQEFEIAGSRTGALVGADCAGGCECESPLGTVNSWDSHSHYRRRAPSPDLSLYEGVIVYCDHNHLKTPTGVIRLLLLVIMPINFEYSNFQTPKQNVGTVEPLLSGFNDREESARLIKKHRTSNFLR